MGRRGRSPEGDYDRRGRFALFRAARADRDRNGRCRRDDGRRVAHPLLSEGRPLNARRHRVALPTATPNSGPRMGSQEIRIRSLDFLSTGVFYSAGQNWAAFGKREKSRKIRKSRQCRI
jgi:hypothetical protein